MICIKIPLSLWMQCWSPRRRFPCSLREWHKTFTFFGKSSFCFSSIRSDGHEECSDYNLAEVFSTKGRKCFPECEKKQKKTKNIKKLISIKFLLSRWMQCWPHIRSFLPSLLDWYNTYTFFENSFFVFPHYVPKDTKNAVITTSLKSCRQKAENFSLKVQKW